MPSAVEIDFSDDHRRHDQIEILTGEKVRGIIPDGETKLHRVASQIIPAKAVDFLAALEVHHFQGCHDLHMVLGFKGEFRPVTPGFHLHIIGFGIAFRHRHIGNVRHAEHEILPILHDFLEAGLVFFHLCLHGLHSRDQLGSIFGRLGRCDAVIGAVLLGPALLDTAQQNAPFVVNGDQFLDFEVDVLLLGRHGHDILVFPDEFDV